MNDPSIPRILVVDDNPAIHDDFRKILCPKARPAGGYGEMRADILGASPNRSPSVDFEVESAFQGKEAVELIKKALEAGNPYNVAFVDMRMPPGWDGMETTENLWQICPDMQVVICTAYSDYSWDDIARRFGSNDGLLILKKPFDNLEVKQLAQTLSQKWILAKQARLRLVDLDLMVTQRTEELRASNQKLTQEIQERSKAEKALSQTQEELRQSQKLEAVGQLAGGVAHDFNNLLSVISSNADMGRMNAECISQEVMDYFNEIGRASERAATLIRQLLAFSRKQYMRVQPVELDKVVMDLSKMLKRLIGEHIELRCVYAPAVAPAEADVGMLEQVLVNLVINARDAMPKGGTLLITTGQRSFERADELHSEGRLGEFVCIAVSDTGIGIPPENLNRIFEPFFSTKEVGKGTGLGLSTVYGIVKQHKGWIEVSSQAGAGSIFKIYLPALKNGSSSPEVETAHSPAPLPHGSETILLVEDDEAVRGITNLILERYGYRVLVANCGPDALKIWETRASEVALLLADVVMPGNITGRQLAEDLRRQKPSLKIVLQSGYDANVMVGGAQFLEQTNSYFLQKPTNPRQLLVAVRRCLDGLPQVP